MDPNLQMMQKLGMQYGQQPMPVMNIDQTGPVTIIEGTEVWYPIPDCQCDQDKCQNTVYKRCECKIKICCSTAFTGCGKPMCM